jgi:hypothetical protein
MPPGDGVTVQGVHQPRAEGRIDGAFAIHVTFDGNRKRGWVKAFAEALGGRPATGRMSVGRKPDGLGRTSKAAG